MKSKERDREKGIWETMQTGGRGRGASAKTRPEAGGGVSVPGPALTILTMPRCTVGTAGPPEVPPLCAEEAMCRDGKAASKAVGRLGGVNVSVGVGGKPPRQRAGKRRVSGNGRHGLAGRSQEQQRDWERKRGRVLRRRHTFYSPRKRARAPPPSGQLAPRARRTSNQ